MLLTIIGLCVAVALLLIWGMFKLIASAWYISLIQHRPFEVVSGIMTTSTSNSGAPSTTTMELNWMTVYAGDMLFASGLAIILLIAASWLLDRKVQV